MCTVIYLPTKKGSLLCSVRDENPNRKRATSPTLHPSEEHSFWSPIDREAGGTWWAVNELGYTVVLLNGAYENHLPNLQSYRKSRGLIVKELVQKTDIIAEWEQVDLVDIEPFTLVVKQNDLLVECRWDGSLKHTHLQDVHHPQIWSSSTLYSKEIQAYRESLFTAFIAQNPECPSDVVQFLNSNRDSENGFIMHRSEKLQSLSISIIEFSDQTFKWTYSDLISNEIDSKTIQLGTP